MRGLAPFGETTKRSEVVAMVGTKWLSIDGSRSLVKGKIGAVNLASVKGQATKGSDTP